MRNMGKRGKGRGRPPGKASAAEAQEERKVSSTRQRKKEQVIHESVFESAVSLFRQNKLFCVKRDGEELFVGCYLPLIRIGGLSAANRNDETKGTLLNKINSGIISVLYTPTLAEEDSIVIIPNKQTVEMLEELWSIMEKTVFDFCFVDPLNEQIEKTDVHTGVVELKALHENNRPVTSIKALADLVEDAVLPEEESLDSVAAEDPADQGGAGYMEMDDEPGGDDDGSGDEDGEDEFPGGFPEGVLDDGDTQEDGPGGDGDVSPSGLPDEPMGATDYEEDESLAFGGYDEQEDGDGEPEEEFVPEGDVDVPYETMSVVLERRFFNEDLTRTLDTAGLDQSLAAAIPFQPLERRSGGWLDDQVNLLIDLANQELYAMHQQNLSTVRQDYLDKMAEAYEREMGKVSSGLEDDERYAELGARLDEQQEALPRMIADERARLEEEFEARVKEVGDSARRSAETSYRERYRSVQDEKLRNVELEMKAAMDTGFRRAVADLKSVRKAEAAVRLDSIDSDAITAATKAYEELASSELALWEKHRDAIKAFLEENREAEIARIRVLGEEQERTTKLEQVEAEYKARVESLQAEFDTRVAGLQSDMEQMKARHAEAMEAKDKEYGRRVNEYRADAEQQQNRIERLLEDVGGMDAKRQEEVAQAVAELKAQRDSSNARYDELVKHQRKGNRLLVALTACGVIVALLVGMFLGMATSDVFGRYMPWNSPGVEETVSPAPVGDVGQVPAEPQADPAAQPVEG